MFHYHLKLNGYLKHLHNRTSKGLNAREAIFLYRKALAKLFIHSVLRVPRNWFNFFIPGLEMKLALDVAQSLNAQVYCAGENFDYQGMEMLRMEKNFDVIFPMLKYWVHTNESWWCEIKDVKKVFTDHSINSLADSYLNKDQIAWFVRCASKFFPQQTDALIHKRSEHMFIALEKELQGKRKMAVVNQWHMDDMEKLWRKAHGIEIRRPATSGAEDMPLAEFVAYMKEHDSDRHKIEELTGTPMAYDQRANVPYYDQNRSHFG